MNEFDPTPEQRDHVEIAAARGRSERAIAAHIGISRETLTKYFSDELANGRDRKRLELDILLFQSARDGNAANQRYLDQVLDVSAAGASVFNPQEDRPAKLGKKEIAVITAAEAGAGSDWGDDLRPPPLQSYN